MAAGVKALATSKNPAITAIGTRLEVAQVRLANLTRRERVARGAGDIGRANRLARIMAQVRDHIKDLGKERRHVRGETAPAHPRRQPAAARTDEHNLPSNKAVVDHLASIGVNLKDLNGQNIAGAVNDSKAKVVGQVAASGDAIATATAAGASAIGGAVDTNRVAVASAASRAGETSARAGYYAGREALSAGYTAARASDVAASRIVQAIYAARPVIQSTNVTRNTTVIQRAGPTGGSGNTSGGNNDARRP